MSFFFKKLGLNADIKRHREQEKQLREEISRYEASGETQHVKTYKHFLNLLLESKAQLTSKIGKQRRT